MLKKRNYQRAEKNVLIEKISQVKTVEVVHALSVTKIFGPIVFYPFKHHLVSRIDFHDPVGPITKWWLHRCYVDIVVCVVVFG